MIKQAFSHKFTRTLFIILTALFIGYIITFFSYLSPETSSTDRTIHEAFQETNMAYSVFLTSPLLKATGEKREFNLMSFSQWINETLPLILTGLAITLVFSAGLLNLGAEGQMFFGAVIGSCIAVIPMSNSFFQLVLIVGASALSGCVWSLLPAYASIKKKNSEIIVSLMMNYLAVHIGLLIVKRFIRDKTSGAMMSVKFNPAVQIPFINQRYKLHIGILFGVFAAILIWYIMKKTRWGLKIKMTGSNMQFAAYSGIKIKKNLLLVQLFSGALAGTAGIFELIGYHGRFLWNTSPGYGWDGIIVALMASKNPLYVPIAALFLAYIRVGAQNMGRYTAVSPELVKIVQAIIILFLTAESIFSKGDADV